MANRWGGSGGDTVSLLGALWCSGVGCSREVHRHVAAARVEDRAASHQRLVDQGHHSGEDEERHGS
jgi:hypothetical protein